jgi:hypothetical protein
MSRGLSSHSRRSLNESTTLKALVKLTTRCHSYRIAAIYHYITKRCAWNSVPISRVCSVANRLHKRDPLHGSYGFDRVGSPAIREGHGVRSSDVCNPPTATTAQHKGGKQDGPRFAVVNTERTTTTVGTLQGLQRS